MTDSPSGFIDKLLRAVVGIEIPIDRLIGKLKASQDEDLQGRLGTITGLAAEGSESALAMADLVRRALDRHTDLRRGQSACSKHFAVKPSFEESSYGEGVDVSR
ncbi:hypothetical protein [Variovorax paradoxus]|uniref:hypothetical protein n=1 Tax=Variovorax paradoxus TaxID=34073 RepID=UPI002785F389|nr:hypothetical protein [Variovorax paradoxus]MDQ0589974.1 hypothetical protein [Variovorax paradoxus]